MCTKYRCHRQSRASKAQSWYCISSDRSSDRALILNDICFIWFHPVSKPFTDLTEMRHPCCMASRPLSDSWRCRSCDSVGESENRLGYRDSMGWMMDATIHSFNVFNAYSWSNAFANDVDCRPMRIPCALLEGQFHWDVGQPFSPKQEQIVDAVQHTGHIWASYAVL